MKEYTYVYECAPSSETRGRRDVHDGGCGHWNTYGTNKRVTGHHRPQASPCKKCERRRRLNPGICFMADDRMGSSRIYLENGCDEHTAWSRKIWAEVIVDEINEETEVRLRNMDLNADAKPSDSATKDSEEGDKNE